ncbi:5'/3'-nucleotidase SurE [Amycolatopsis orientalis]|uniref:5'-nucleotidase n=1 Tax=Amycolatopsis orientalis TaxID=31958 RepID=A0A193BYH1_AMYOR|nr:5'/3'-nucleotidase SurE [Amycolatopsis orientalis]ANN17218.1 5'/3'-nucleotidase SurE [Amycolatopsis orientalis]
MRALITNDDGIDSPGLAALARGAVDHGWTVVVAAPAAEASGTSAGLTGAGEEGRVTVERRELSGLPDVPAFAVAAHPGLIALAAAQGTFGEAPEIVLSGVNHGANVGRAILHSGTVGAALTASINGARALAVSLDVGLEPGPRPHWDTAVAVAATLFDRLTELPAGTVLNLNVPDRAEARPPTRTGLAEFGAVRSHVQNGEDGAFTVAAITVEGELSQGSDARLLSEGHATVTALNSVSENPDLDW